MRPQPVTRRARRHVAPLLALLLLAVAAVPASAIHITLDSGDADIEIESEDVVITIAGRKARISPQGGLVVDGKRTAVSARDQRDLSRYNASIHWLEDQAVDLGMQGAGLAIAALGEAFAAIVTRDEKGAERRVEARAERLQEDARELCEELRRLERVQDRLVRNVAAFEPFAVFEVEADDCRVDDEP